MSHRRRDPSTSVEASEAAQSFVRCHQSAILAALGLWGPAGKTALSGRCGLNDVAVCRRLSELHQAGLVAVDGVEYSAAGRKERRFKLVGGGVLNYYEHHLGDWAAATGHLTWDEDMAYTRLLRAYYHAEKAIPEGQQYRLAKASTPAQRKAVDAVLAEFFLLSDGAYHQKRADAEISRYLDKQRKAKASANARWSHTERNANASPDAMRTHSECNALQTPDTRHQTPKEEKTKTPRSRALPCPDGVADQVWSDWQALRKAKRAPVTETVVDGARAEAIKAGMTLDAFLRVWCARGSQGLQADWLKPEERAAPAMPAWKTEQLARTAAFAGPAASKQAQEAAKTVAGAGLFGHRPLPHHNEVSDAFTPLLG